MDAYVVGVIEHTIWATNDLLSQKRVEWKIAREGVKQIIANLCLARPDEATEIKKRLEPYIHFHDRAYGAGNGQAPAGARRHMRVVPQCRETTLKFSDHASPIAAEVLNVSASGVGLRAATKPMVGSTISVGARAVRVVRLFDGGFAGEFAPHLSEGEITSAIQL